MSEHVTVHESHETLVARYVAEHLPIDVAALEAARQQAACTPEDPAVVLRLTLADQPFAEAAARTQIFETLRETALKEHPDMVLQRDFQATYEGRAATEVRDDALSFEIIRLFTPVRSTAPVAPVLGGAGVRVSLVQ